MKRHESLKTVEQEDRALVPILDELEEILSSPGDVFPDRLREIVLDLKARLGRHLALEEEALFPVLERHLPRGGGPLEILEQDHRTIRRLLEALALAVAYHDAPATRKSGQALAFVLRKHNEEEHRVLFPVAFRMFSAEDRRKVEAAIERIEEEARAVSPDHGSEVSSEGRIDLRSIPVWERPRAISRAFASLREGDVLEVVSHEEPSALYHPFATEWSGSFEWNAEERVPLEWRIRIRKATGSPVAPALGVLESGSGHTICG